MKKILTVLTTVFLIACGNQSAENTPTDLDRTKNNDTSAVNIDRSARMQKDSTDSLHVKQ